MLDLLLNLFRFRFFGLRVIRAGINLVQFGFQLRFCFSSALVSVVLDVEVVYDVEPETADILIIIPPFLTSNIILLQIRNVKTR